jgi:hypothetical protein
VVDALKYVVLSLRLYYRTRCQSKPDAAVIRIGDFPVIIKGRPFDIELSVYDGFESGICLLPM